ncbi:hypothetical protein FS749_003206 [Ceratobasidium sp. UAMH 11750]|nr:hypothetical protein FS749_003206 [Ceratobasidium sp. UAMH 11750]
MPQYMLERATQRPTARAPTPRQISEDFMALRSGSPSCPALNRILLLPERPKQLRHFLNGGLTPRCMMLLRAYCETNSLFDHEYGVLCFQTLLLVLEVGLLETINPNILNYNNDYMVNHEHFTGALGSTMRQLISISKPPGPGGKLYLQDLRWSRTSRDTNTLACLPVVGGLTRSDVKFLLENMPGNLGILMSLLTISQVLGFGTLLFLAWQHQIYVDADVEACVVLQNLTIRYWPVSLHGEHGILRYIFTWLDARVKRRGDGPRLISHDSLDMRLLTDAYTTAIYSEHKDPLPLPDAASLVEFLASSDGLTVPTADLVGGLVKNAISRCWLELEGAKKDLATWQSVARLCGSALE